MRRLALLLPAIVAAMAIPLAYTGQLAPAEEYSCEGCSLLLVTADTLRADHVSSYGYFQQTTPNIDALASRGILFEQAYTQVPFTPPSHWTIMTGLYPFHHGMYLPTNESRLETLATRLSRSGYDTAAFTASYMVGRLERGFGVFEVPAFRTEKEYRPATNVTESALSWLMQRDGEGPFFLWVHYFDAHSPYQPPDGHDIYDYSMEPRYADERYSRAGIDNFRPIRDDIARYDGEVRYMDNQLGRLLGELESLGLSENTMVAVVSDHGECFGEHLFSDFGYEMTGPCLFHDKTLYQEEVHVPMVLYNPRARRSSGTRIGEIVETADLAPTLLETLCLIPPEGLDGRSMVPLIEGNSSGFGRAFMQIRPGETGIFAYGLLSPEWKFVRAGLSLDRQGHVQEHEMLFDRKNDPREMVNALGQRPGPAQEMEEELAEVMGSGLSERVYIDSRTEEMLRMLGYLA